MSESSRQFRLWKSVLDERFQNNVAFVRRCIRSASTCLLRRRAGLRLHRQELAGAVPRRPRCARYSGIARLGPAVLFACTVPGVASVAAEPADETVRRVIERLADNEPVALWHALPSSYQEDLHGTVHLFAEQVDADVWGQTIGTLAKLTRVLDEKREYITGHPMVAMQMQATEAPSDVYQAFVDILTTVSTCEISDLDQMRSLDLEAFFSGTLTRLMEQFSALGQLAPGPVGELDNLRATRVTLESSDGDSAIVRIETPDQPAEVKEFVLVEGKWIPKEMADDWTKDIADTRLKMADWSSDSQSSDKAQSLAMLGMVDSTLDSLLAAQTAEEFSATIEGIVQLVAMMIPSDDGAEEPR